MFILLRLTIVLAAAAAIVFTDTRFAAAQCLRGGQAQSVTDASRFASFSNRNSSVAATTFSNRVWLDLGQFEIGQMSGVE